MKLEWNLASQNKRYFLSNALVESFHSSRTKQKGWQRYVQWHTAARQCVTDRSKHLTSLIDIDTGILVTTGDNQPLPIVEKWPANEVVVIGFDAYYTVELLTYTRFHIL